MRPHLLCAWAHGEAGLEVRRAQVQKARSSFQEEDWTWKGVGRSLTGRSSSRADLRPSAQAPECKAVKYGLYLVTVAARIVEIIP